MAQINPLEGIEEETIEKLKALDITKAAFMVAIGKLMPRIRPIRIKGIQVGDQLAAASLIFVEKLTPGPVDMKYDFTTSYIDIEDRVGKSYRAKVSLDEGEFDDLLFFHIKAFVKQTLDDALRFHLESIDRLKGVYEAYELGPCEKKSDSGEAQEACKQDV